MTLNVGIDSRAADSTALGSAEDSSEQRSDSMECLEKQGKDIF